MSIHTKINHDEIHQFLDAYPVGALQSYTGIEAGITNTIYHVCTSDAEYILTIFEELTAKQLPFYLQLMEHFAAQQLPCQRALANKMGNYIAKLRYKPAVLLNYLPGSTLEHACESHCAQVGKLLAQMHQSGSEFKLQQANYRGADWREQTALQLLEHLSIDDAALLTDELAFHQQHPLKECPQGIIHADLFRDNVLFDDGYLTGVLDFYYACNDSFIYDLAITINAWCFDENARLNQARYQALMQAYEQQRKLSLQEQEAKTVALRLAALRFWLSRLYDFNISAHDNLVQVHDPDVFKHILLFHRT